MRRLATFILDTTIDALYWMALWLAGHDWPRLAVLFGGPAMLLDLYRLDAIARPGRSSGKE